MNENIEISVAVALHVMNENVVISVELQLRCVHD